MPVFEITLTGYDSDCNPKVFNLSFDAVQSALDFWHKHVRRDVHIENVYIVHAVLLRDGVQLAALYYDKHHDAYEKREMSAMLRLFKDAYADRNMKVVRRAMHIIRANKNVSELFESDKAIGFRYKDDCYAIHKHANSAIHKHKISNEWVTNSSWNDYVGISRREPDNNYTHVRIDKNLIIFEWRYAGGYVHFAKCLDASKFEHFLRDVFLNWNLDKESGAFVRPYYCYPASFLKENYFHA